MIGCLRKARGILELLNAVVANVSLGVKTCIESKILKDKFIV